MVPLFAGSGLGKDGRMVLGTFYALMSVTCFTLVGLWWTVVERLPAWRTDRRLRRMAGGTYLSFLLPGVMSMFAQVNPASPLMWRVSFGRFSSEDAKMTGRTPALFTLKGR